MLSFIPKSFQTLAYTDLWDMSYGKAAKCFLFQEAFIARQARKTQ